MTDTTKKQVCKYGDKCYRKSRQHFEEFLHPSDPKTEEELQPPSKKRKTITSFFTPKVKQATEHSEQPETSSKEKEAKDEVQDAEISAAHVAHQDGPPSPKDMKENIKSKFLVDMPQDFYQFWDLAKSIKSSAPQDAFMTSLGLQLVGPYDILAGNHVKKNKRGNRPNYLRHWRYYYDPPEFLTVIRGDDKTQFHMGYFRDDPSEMPVFVASNVAKENGTITPRGENLFAAVNWYIDDKIKKTKGSEKATLVKMKEKVAEAAKKGGYLLDQKTKSMKARDKKVNCKLFHGAGMVVPVDAAGVGYREVPETPGDLKKMMKKIAEAEDEESRNKAFDPLMEIIMLIQFANDECDYGEGLELGLDLFTFGHGHVFKSTILNLMPLAYQLLGRPEYKQIIEAHLEDRQHTSRLSQLV